ncbi:MAG: hypothetical protein R6U50_07775 [Desulfobacterales bacterium]
MKSLYFPFTTLSAEAAKRLNSFFSQTVVYGIGYATENDVSLSGEDQPVYVKTPVSGDEDRLASVLKAYKNWANIHDDRSTAFLTARRSPVPFYSDTAVSRIKADIKKRIGAEAPTETPVDDVFVARLFLALAQEHDAQEITAMDRLMTIEQMEQDLYDGLKGEPEKLERLLSAGRGDAQADLGEYMVSERMRSWSILHLNDPEEYTVYATDSTSVITHLLENRDTAEKPPAPLWHISPVPVRNNNNHEMMIFSKALEGLLQHSAESQDVSGVTPPEPPAPEIDEKTVGLAVYRFPGIHPKTFFRRFAPRTAGMHNVNESSSIQNTVVCLIRQPIPQAV